MISIKTDVLTDMKLAPSFQRFLSRMGWKFSITDDPSHSYKPVTESFALLGIMIATPFSSTGKPMETPIETPEPFVFIHRDGDRLMQGENEFRFVSFNHPNLHISENPDWRRMTAWEQEDGVRSIAQMGGRVVRLYTFSVKGGKRNGQGLSHINAPGNYNEALFEDLDRVLVLCRRYGIRIILPFLDEWDWFGGIGEFSAFYGKNKESFYSDPAIQKGFRDFVSWLVQRKNTITGVRYSEDPTIMAWESGNELRNDPADWLSGLASFVKEMAPHQLFQDGHCGIRPESLQDPHIDLLTNHYYGHHDYALAARKDRDASRGLKPFYVGEFDPREMSGLLEEVCSNGSAGALFWSLRGHRKEGGYFCHFDPLFYHWPYDKETRIARRFAYRIQGKSEPMMELPDAPQLLPIGSVIEISWMGSTGASSYQLERSPTESGPWILVSDSLSDNKNELPLYSDMEATREHNWFYRLKASNEAGSSAYSDVMVYRAR